MTSVNRWLRQLNKSHLVLVLPLVTVSAVLAATTHVAQADQIRVCENYGVVRDRSDHEAPLLPRRSIAHCARSYQTLYHTHRVLRASPNSRVNNSNTVPNSTEAQENPQVENPTSTPSITSPHDTDPTRSSADTSTQSD